jgi:hypothetical protein
MKIEVLVFFNLRDTASLEDQQSNETRGLFSSVIFAFESRDFFVEGKRVIST